MMNSLGNRFTASIISILYLKVILVIKYKINPNAKLLSILSNIFTPFALVTSGAGYEIFIFRLSNPKIKFPIIH